MVRAWAGVQGALVGAFACGAAGLPRLVRTLAAADGALRVLYSKRSTKEIYTDPLPVGEGDRYTNKYLQQQ